MGNRSGNVKGISELLDTNFRNQVAENRSKLMPIIDSIIFCGRLGIPLRGHRDDSKYHPDAGEYSTGGVGNFIELLNYRVRGGDNILKEHMLNHSKNASYLSKSAQNDIIGCCGQVVTEQIIKEIKLNKFFTVIADEASDCSNKEQMSLVLRYVDQHCNINEKFIRFIHCKYGLCGKDLAKALLESLSGELTLDIQNCRGQGYDGAGAVSGPINGLASHIMSKNDKALYTHCYSHRLNLSICASTKVQAINNCLDSIREVSYFFNFSQTRQQILDNHINNLFPASRVTKLKDVCRTRWVDRIEGLDTFQTLYVAVVFTLEDIFLKRLCNRDTISKALSYYKLLTNFEFIVALVITRSVFDIMLPATHASNKDQ